MTRILFLCVASLPALEHSLSNSVGMVMPAIVRRLRQPERKNLAAIFRREA